MANHRVGGEVDAFCTRCKLTLAHTILAMVGSKIARVHCNTCAGDHVFRTESRFAAGRGNSPAPKERPSRSVLSFEAQLVGKDPAKAKDYSPKHSYQADDLVRHPSFGLGVVAMVREGKVEITFKQTTK